VSKVVPTYINYINRYMYYISSKSNIK